MASMSSLVETFTGNVLNPAVWEAVDNAGTFSFQSDGRYTFIAEEGASDGSSLRTLSGYDLTGSHIHVQLLDPGVPDPSLATFPVLLSQNNVDTDNSIFTLIVDGSAEVSQIVAGVLTVMATFPFTFADMQWWRIREAAGTLYVETAPHVLGPWTVQASGAPLIAITDLFAWSAMTALVPMSTAKQSAIANVNFTPAPDLPFPNGAIPIGLEAAFGADLSGDPLSWVWTDLTDAVMDQTVSTTRGRQDESNDVDPTQSALNLDNPDGDLTPGNAASPYWPNVDLGTPARFRIEHTRPRLLLPPLVGARSEVASIPALDITSDLDVRFDLHAKTTDPSGANVTLAGRYTLPGSFSWSVDLEADRDIRLSWSTTGVGPPDSEAISSVPVLPSSARAFLRVTLTVNNGSGGNDARFYIGDSMSGPWTQIGTTVTGVGVTSIFNTTDPLILGSGATASNTFMPDADVYAFELLQGIGGAPIADPVFSAQASGVPSFVDGAGRVWIVFAPAAITNRWFRAVGTVDSWTPTWPYGDLSSQQPGGLGRGQARVGITLSGILRRLGQGAPALDSALRRSIVDERTLRAYWPMEDSQDSSQFASALPSGSPMPVGGEISFANNDELIGSKPLPTFSGTTFFAGPVVGPFTGQWQVDWYIHVPLASITTGTWSIRRVTTTGTVLSWEVRINTGALAVFGFGASGAQVTTASTVGPPVSFFDQMIHIRLFAVQDGPNVDWTLKWEPVTYPASTPVSISNTYAGTVGGVTGVGFTPGVGMDAVVMGHIAVFDAADIDTTGPAAVGWIHETAMDRIARLCSEESVPLRVIGSSADTALMGPQPVGTLLDLIDEAQDADAGILYERPDTVGLIYRTRTSLYNQPPNMTLNALNEELQNPFEPVKDDQQIRNFVTVQREGGSESTVTDPASIAKVGIYSDSLTLNLFEDSQTTDAAAWRLHQGIVTDMRYPQVSTHLGAAPQVIDQWLTCDVGSRIEVDNLPPQRPSPQVQVILEGYSEDISPQSWDPTVNASPGQVWDVAELDGPWVSDDYLFRLDTDGSQLASPAGTAYTTLTVQITNGSFWVTDPSEFPFDIDVDGEQIKVTAISAAVGDDQDFTVVRSINGIIKSHIAGAVVELWLPPVLAR